MDKHPADFGDLITQAEAARLREVTRSAIFDLLKRGRLLGVEVAGRTFVRRSEVLSIEKARTGPKPKTRRGAESG